MVVFKIQKEVGRQQANDPEIWCLEFHETMKEVKKAKVIFRVYKTETTHQGGKWLKEKCSTREMLVISKIDRNQSDVTNSRVFNLCLVGTLQNTTIT